MIFLDYDNIEFSWLVEELIVLQELHDIGNFYVFESSDNSYHAVCIDKVPLHEYVKILRSSSVDPNYVNVPLYHGKKIWTLRLTDKEKPIRFVGVIKSDKFSLFEQSSAHANILNNLFDLDIEMMFPDNEKDVIIARYPI